MTTCVYVSNADDGSVQALELQPEGHLKPLQRVELGGTVMPMVTAPDRRVLYVARRSDPLAVVALSIDPASGLLTKLGEAELPASMAYLTIDRSGRWLLAASYPAHLVSVHGIGDHRMPQPAHQIVADVPNAHCVRLGADNTTAFVASLGADQVRCYAFDERDGRLASRGHPAAPFPAKSGPRHIEFHPSLPLAYVLNELDGHVHVFDVAGPAMRHRQRVDTCPQDRPTPVSCADVRATPDGRFVYTTERTGSTITGLCVDAATGELSTIGHWPTQRQPRAMAIDPRGRFLLSAGQLSDRIGVHAIGNDGVLSPVGEVDVGRRPSWIEVISLSR
jgi:6-phosphogluconolactonase